MAELEQVGGIVPTIAKVSEIEQQAQANKEKRALPTPPGKLVGFKDLQDWLKLLTTEEQKQRITLWVYRREPIINRQLVDPQADNNIDIVFNGFEKLTEEYMKENHGGGNYKFTVKDGDKPKTQIGGFFEAVLNMPIIEQKEGATPQPSGINSDMLKMMLDFTAKMSDKEQAAFKQKIGGEDA